MSETRDRISRSGGLLEGTRSGPKTSALQSRIEKTTGVVCSSRVSFAEEDYLREGESI